MSEAVELRIMFVNTIKQLCVNPDNYLSEWYVIEWNDDVRYRCEDSNIEYPHEGGEWDCFCHRYDQHHGRCICTNHIIRYCVLKNRFNGVKILVGQDCGRKYLNLTKSLRCKECNKKLTKKEGYGHQLCKVCVSRVVFRYGSKRGQSYYQVWENDSSFCQYTIKYAINPPLTHFRDWLLMRQTI